MAVDIEEIKQQAEEQVANAQATIQEDGWSQAFDSIIHGDFTGFSVLIAVLLLVIFWRPILFLVQFAAVVFVIFMIVKVYVVQQ